MFRFNEIIQTKNGEYVKPFAVQGNIVLCADRQGNTVKRALTDFDFSVPKEKKIISVAKSNSSNKPVVKTKDVEVGETVEPETNTPEPTNPEPTEPEPEENTNPGSIWDTVDDGYI